MNKVEVVARILRLRVGPYTVIFCRTKRTAARPPGARIDRPQAASALRSATWARVPANRRCAPSVTARSTCGLSTSVATECRARYRRRRRHARHQLPVPRREDLHHHPSHGRTGRGQLGHGRHLLRGLGRYAALVAHLQALGPGCADPLGALPPPLTCSPTWTFRSTTGRPARAKRTRAGLDAEVLEDLGGCVPAPRDEAVAAVAGRVRGRVAHRGGLRGRSARGASASSSDASRSIAQSRRVAAPRTAIAR